MDKILKLLEAMQRGMIRLNIGADGPIVWGRTRFGGCPDVPAGFVWPTFTSDTFYDDTVKPRPLSFLAQFDCGALAAMDPEGLLPRTGILSFFYELGSARWGFDPADAGCGRVYWFDGSQPLAPAPFPHELDEEFRLPRLRVQAKADHSFASWADFAQVHPELDEDELFEDYIEAYEVIGGSGDCSKLLGWPDVIQDNMTLECELVSRGYNLGGLDEFPAHLAAREGAASVENWRLLFQLDSFEMEDFDLNFGDDGALYFYIRTEDLKARRFDRVWVILQCG